MAAPVPATQHQQIPQVMRLHIARGGFFTDDDDVQRSCTEEMDPSVWSKMSDDILEHVFLQLPAAKLFQLQLLSPKWRAKLTSTNFRKKVNAAARERDAATTGEGESRDHHQQRQPGRVVACVMKECDNHDFISPNMKMVDVDVSSFLPSKFWKRKTAAVIACAADGLLCVYSSETLKDEEDNVCVLNPLTRTCKVLPPLPSTLWPQERPQGLVRMQLQLSTTEVAVIAYTWYADLHAGKYSLECRVATYDLTTGGGGGRWSVAQGLIKAVEPAPNSDLRNEDDDLDLAAPLVALCGGRTFSYCWDRRVHVHERPRGPALAPDVDAVVQLVEVAVLDAPSVVLLGLQAPKDGEAEYLDKDVFLVAHRGAVFFVASLLRSPSTHPHVVAGVWRLAGAAASEPTAMKWEQVARLEVQGGEREESAVVLYVEEVVGVCAVREFLCCTLRVRIKVHMGGHSFRTSTFNDIMMCFNLNTAQWERLHEEDDLVHREDEIMGPGGALALELRPDVFLL